MNEKRARQALRARSGGVCEMCGSRPATDAHHRKNRSQGGLWSPENLLHLCHQHHMHVTTHPAIARENGWSVSAYRDPAVEPVWLAGRGWSVLRPDGAITSCGEGAA